MTVKRISQFFLIAAAFASGAWIDRQLLAPTTTPLETAQPSTVSSAPTPAQSNATSPAFRWSRIEAEQYPKFIANLRAIGCPEQTIRDIVIADLSQLYSSEWKRGLTGGRTNYWESQFGADPVVTDTRRFAALGLRTNLQGVVRALLGADLDKELRKYSDLLAMTISRDEMLADFLSPEKAAAVERLMHRRDAQIAQLENQPFATPESLLSVKQAMDQHEAELAGILTPDELEQWRYRFSPLAEEIRGKVAGFDLSEDEFKRLYAAQEQVKNQLYGQIATQAATLDSTQLMGLTSSAEMGEETLKAVLGFERFQDYQKSRDVTYQQLMSFARQNDVSTDLVEQVYARHAQSSAQVQELQQNESLTQEQRDQLAREIQSSTEQSLAGIVGQETLEKIRFILPISW